MLPAAGQELIFVVMIHDGVVHVAKLDETMATVMAKLTPDRAEKMLAMTEGERAVFGYGQHKLEVGTSPAGVPTFATQAEADAWLEARADDVHGIVGWGWG